VTAHFDLIEPGGQPRAHCLDRSFLARPELHDVVAVIPRCLLGDAAYSTLDNAASAMRSIRRGCV
jgi:hypothetical protein